MSTQPTLNATHVNPLWMQAWVLGHPYSTSEAAQHLANQLVVHRPHHQISGVAALSSVPTFKVPAHTFCARRAQPGHPGFNAYPQSAIDLEGIRRGFMDAFPGVVVVMASQDKVSKLTTPVQNNVPVDISLWGSLGLRGFPVVSTLSRAPSSRLSQELVHSIHQVFDAPSPTPRAGGAQVFITEIARILGASGKAKLQEWLAVQHRHAHLDATFACVAEAQLVKRL